ncbi:hypothetical protein Q8F55_002889 [Vanrija albida]|uniref:HTH APSES-type domain-containing protein n=1 Tax=Vanrija albida TaxID=181172 RepID=A0ABR3QC21_9TREE
MAICGACAVMGNVALSPDEIAAVAFDHGWIRPPSVAVSPATMIANAIRMHQSRCQKATPQRTPVLSKYQLAGSIAESVLQPALHPAAFDGPTRPKGPVWYLSPDVGRSKWRNPFTGLVVPKAPVRKPAQPKPKQAKPATKKDDAPKAAAASRRKDKSSTPEVSSASSTPAPSALPRIKLRVSASGAEHAAAMEAEDAEAEAEAAPTASRASSVSFTPESPSSTPAPFTPQPNATRRRRRDNVFDSSDSESSESEAEHEHTGHRRAPRRVILPPLAVSAGSRFPQIPSRPVHSTFGELFFSPVQAGPLPLPAVQQSPFPCHSLDNTIWGARRSVDLEQIAFEASSSSSSDDEMGNTDWGTGSGLLVKAGDEAMSSTWAPEEDAKVNAATVAMRELFPYSPENPTTRAEPVFNQLDNRPPPSDTSSVTDTSSTATATAVFQGKLRSAACPTALPAWTLSSPVSSPSLAGRQLPLYVETSPTQYLSRVTRDLDARSMDMDVDVTVDTVDESWLDESGHLPVYAEEVISDVEIEVGSSLGEVTTPERDRQLQTAEWARETAGAASALNIKQEPEDYYPSPAATTSTDMDDSVLIYDGSRESTVSSQSPSSGSSELPELEEDCTQEFLLGPESLTLDELDDWLPTDKAERTPHRGRGRGRPPRSESTHTRSSGSWGGIGVNNPFVPPIASFSSVSTTKVTPPPLVRKRSLRSSARRNRSAVRKTESTRNTQVVATTDITMTEPAAPETVDVQIDTEPECEEDAIGPDELESARVEAEAREEQHRAKRRAEAEENRRRWNACRKAFADATASSGSASPTLLTSGRDSGEATPVCWPELTANWSSDSIPELATPTTLSPMALQMTVIDPCDTSSLMALDPKSLHSPTMSAELVMLESVLAQVDIAPVAAPAPAPVSQSPTSQPITVSPQLPKLAPAPPPPVVTAPAPVPSAPVSVPVPAAATPAVVPSLPAIAAAPAAPAAATSAPTPIAPKQVPSAPPKQAPVQPKQAPVQPKQSPVKAPKPIAAAPAPIAPAPPATVPTAGVPVKAKSLPTTPVINNVPVQPATSAPTSAPTTAAPTRTVSPIARTATASPATSVASTGSGAAPTPAARPATPSGGTTKRLLPGIDACVIDNLPCYSHVFEITKGGRCTVLRRLDTDFVNGTALLTALGVPPAVQAEALSTPSPTLASHRTVPLISPQGMHHAPGVPGVWIPLIEARDLARKFNLQETRLLANILREDLFQLFKELAGISLRHTSSTESFGMPFVTQPHPRPGARPAPPGTNAAAHARQAPAPGPGKGPLVRAAPAAAPDGAPLPKRRKSSVVGGATGPQVVRAAAAAAGAPPPRPPVAAPGPTLQARPPLAAAAPTPVKALAPAPVPAKAPATQAVTAAPVIPPVPAQPRRTRASVGAK